MKKVTLLIIPENGASTSQIKLPYFLIKSGAGFLVLCFIIGFYLLSEYVSLVSLQSDFRRISAENQHLRGEVKIVMQNLKQVRTSLRRIQDYTTKVAEIVNLQVSTVGNKVGIGPLTKEELSIKDKREVDSSDGGVRATVPLGIDFEQLVFSPVLEEMETVEVKAKKQAIELQTVLSVLSQKKSLLSSIPSISPVRGWITSDFGNRVSPFTGARTLHKAIDIAAPIGTPILAPADGVVIFSGAKVGFGNFIMIAHYGSGIITRFGHNSQNMVEAGQRVQRGDQIATVGITGRSTGPHLHYETWVNGVAADPRKFILDMGFDLN